MTVRTLLLFTMVGSAWVPVVVNAQAPVQQLAAAVNPSAAPAPAHHPRENTYIKRKWGVELLFVRETAAGHMLEFRYKVLDPDKALPLFIRKDKPILTHERTGAELEVPVPPKTGALRNSDAPIEGRVYWMFFANPGLLVRPGDAIDIRIGEFEVKGLVVQEG